MSIFLIAAIIAFCGYVSAASYAPRKMKDANLPHSPKRDAVAAGETQASQDFMKRAFAILILIVSISLLLVLLYIFRESLVLQNSPEEPYLELIGSRHLAHLFFGLMFGTMFGYWSMTVLRRDPEKPVSYPEIASGVLMIIFLIVGLAGEDFLVSMLSRITTLEVAGTKLSFSDVDSGKSFATTGNSSSGTANPNPPAQSSDLVYIQTIPDAVKRDAEGVAMLASSLHLTADADSFHKELDSIVEEAKRVFSPTINCLVDYVKLTGDEEHAGRILEPFALQMRARDFAGSDLKSNDGSGDSLEMSFRAHLQAIKVGTTGDQSEKCKALREIGEDKTIPWLDDGRVAAWIKTPYWTILYSSMFAYNHDNISAVTALDRWMRMNDSNKTENSDPGGSITEKIIRNWIFEIRIRTMMFNFLDEWSNRSYGVKTPQVTQYQIHNLARMKHLIEFELNDLVKPALVKMQARSNGLAAHGFTNAPSYIACEKPDNVDEDNWNNALYMARTLITTRLNWVLYVLDSSEYYAKYARDAQTIVDDLVNLDVSCLKYRSFGSDEAIRFKQEAILEVYARVALANLIGTEQLQQIRSEEEIRHGLEVALQAVRTAQKLSAPDIENTANGSFLDAIAAPPDGGEKLHLEQIQIAIERVLAVQNH
jgi:hypothetical protein